MNSLQMLLLDASCADCGVCSCSNADVECQIGHLRAQLLRSEQDNELMRIKLEQETAEREKAQKQVGCYHLG
jgi:hypothetical protein